MLENWGGGGGALRLGIFRSLKVCYPEKNAFTYLWTLPMLNHQLY